MNTLTKKATAISSFALATTMLFTLSSCTLFNKELSKKDTLDIYSKVSSTIVDNTETNTIKALANIPIKKIEHIVKTSVKEKGDSNPEDTVDTYTITKTGDQTNLCFEMVSNEDNKISSGYLYINNGKYYSAENSMTNSPTEIDEDAFTFAVALTYMIQVYDLTIGDEETTLIGTKAINEGFTSSTKGLMEIKITSEIEYTTTVITLKKPSILKIFTEEYVLDNIVTTTKSVVGSTTTTTVETLNYSY